MSNNWLAPIFFVVTRKLIKSQIIGLSSRSNHRLIISDPHYYFSAYQIGLPPFVAARQLIKSQIIGLSSRPPLFLSLSNRLAPICNDKAAYQISNHRLIIIAGRGGCGLLVSYHII